MKVETQEQAEEIIKAFYESRGIELPRIDDIQVLHADDAITTIRYHVVTSPVQITQTIKIVGSGEATLLE